MTFEAAPIAPAPGTLARVSSYAEWGPIVAGAVTAAAISFVLLTFGSSIGLSATSARPGHGLPWWALALIATLWMLFVQAGSYALGGYLSGRLRAPVGSAYSAAERQFRDGAHGFLAWALGVVITALVVGWTAGSIADTTAKAVATASSGASQHGTAAGGPMSYTVDRLFRPVPGAAPRLLAIPGTSAFTDSRVEDRNETLRIFGIGLARGAMTEDDRAYLIHLVMARTGLPAAEATTRVDNGFAEAQKVAEQARKAADDARKAAAIAGFLTAASLLVGGAAAAAGAGLGGRHRDEERTLRVFGRPYLW